MLPAFLWINKPIHIQQLLAAPSLHIPAASSRPHLIHKDEVATDTSSSDTAMAILERRAASTALNEKGLHNDRTPISFLEVLLHLIKFWGSSECWMSNTSIRKQRERGQTRLVQIKANQTDQNQCCFCKFQVKRL